MSQRKKSRLREKKASEQELCSCKSSSEAGSYLRRLHSPVWGANRTRRGSPGWIAHFLCRGCPAFNLNCVVISLCIFHQALKELSKKCDDLLRDLHTALETPRRQEEKVCYFLLAGSQIILSAFEKILWALLFAFLNELLKEVITCISFFFKHPPSQPDRRQDVCCQIATIICGFMLRTFLIMDFFWNKKFKAQTWAAGGVGSPLDFQI